MEKSGLLALGAFVAAFLIAQIWKLIAGVWQDRGRVEKRTLKSWAKYFMRSGGMPSGHAASFTALTVFLGCVAGFDSVSFALAVGVWGIVLYDATHVRYAVGVQGAALNGLLRKNGEAELPVVEGHTLPQVVVGVIIGVIVGVGMAMLVVPTIA